MQEAVTGIKLLIWVGSSKNDLKKLPEEVIKNIGTALLTIQWGEKPKSAKPLKGFGSAKILEIIEDDPGGTYRAVYTIKFEDAIYVLHVFQKKSKSGIATPKKEIDLIKARLKIAQEYSESR